MTVVCSTWVPSRSESASHQMHDVDVAPLLAQVLRDEPSVTLVRRVLAAQQAATVEQRARGRLLDPALSHQREEQRLVDGPVALLLLERRQDVLRRGEVR